MSKLTIANLLNADNLATAIKSIKTRGAKLDQDIQIAACSAIKNHSEHFSTNLVNDLIAALPKGSRVNALREFINTFSGCSYDEVTKLFVNDKSKTADIEGAMDVKWTEFKPEPAYHALKFDAEIKKLLDKAVKAMNDTNPENVAKNDINIEHVIALGKVIGVDIVVPESVEG